MGLRKSISAGATATERGLPAGTKGRCVTLTVRASRKWSTPASSERVEAISSRFGISSEAEDVVVLDGVRIQLKPGHLILIQGPSGVGKSLLLQELSRRCPHSRFVNRVTFRSDKCLVEQILPGAPLGEAVHLLTGCAMGEPRLWLRRFHELSDGEQFRARLARSISLQAADGKWEPLLCDEFCAQLGRRAAKAVAFNLRRQVNRLGLCAVVATTHDDLEADLQPDRVVRMIAPGCHTVEEPEPQVRPMSLSRRMHIEPGRCADYRKFAPMHYRRRDELGFVDRVFIMRDGVRGEKVGIVLYAHAPLELALRNKATQGRFIRNAVRLNRELRILRRLVIDPELRGCGLGSLLVRKTLPLVGTRFVECLANMGDLVPVFQRAGMERIGQCPLPKSMLRVEADLQSLGAAPMTPEFAAQVGRRPRVRRLVAQVIYRWYCGLTNSQAARRRVERQSAEKLAQSYRQLRGSRPVYFLWERSAGAVQQQRAAG